MGKQRLAVAGVTLLAATLAMTACGSRAETGGDGGGGGEDKVAKIGVIAPLSGDLSELGLGIQNSVDLAVKEANESGDFEGWTLEIAAEDDEGKPDPARNAGTKLAGDEEVVAVVGTLNSSTGTTVQPVLDAAQIAMVSPANTNPSLTRGADPLGNPERTYPGYFRTCTTDAIQGPFAARYLYEDLGMKKVATVHDKKTYGQGLVDAFSGEFEKLGGEIVAAETINPDDAAYSAVVSKIAPLGAEAVYYGGEYPQAGPLSQQMKSGGLDVPLMGGDGIYADSYLKQAGKAGTGDLATSVGAPTEDLESAQAFVDAYAAEEYDEEYGAYGAYAYDAATAVIEGLKTSLPDAEDAKSARPGTIEAIGGVSFDGATGPVGFDEYGDAVTRVLTVYEVKDGAWAAVKTDEFKE